MGIALTRRVDSKPWTCSKRRKTGSAASSLANLAAMRGRAPRLRSLVSSLAQVAAVRTLGGQGAEAGKTCRPTMWR